MNSWKMKIREIFFCIFKFMIFNKPDNVKLAYAVGRKTEEEDGTDYGSFLGELMGKVCVWCAGLKIVHSIKLRDLTYSYCWFNFQKKSSRIKISNKAIAIETFSFNFLWLFEAFKSFRKLLVCKHQKKIHPFLLLKMFAFFCWRHSKTLFINHSHQNLT